MGYSMNNSKEKIGPFSDNPIMIGYDNRLFDFDAEFGYVFPNNQLVDEKGFIAFEDKIAALKKRDNKNFLVLNIGDSSVSGWNSDNVYKGCPDPTAALFSYKTYSDILENKYSVDVINAGVPGYTTYQAKKYTVTILKALARNEIFVDYVSTYLGNNDCAFNGLLEDKTRIDYKAVSQNEILTRVSEADFIRNYEELLGTIKDYGAMPVVLIPALNYRGRPGLRSKKYIEEFQRQIKEFFHEKVRSMFFEAERAYQSGNYELALEKDLLLPRIKNGYKKILESLISQQNTLFIDAHEFIKDENDFVDYCHPTEKVNEQIAKAISGLLKNKNTAYVRKIDVQDLPADTYTLY